MFGSDFSGGVSNRGGPFCSVGEGHPQGHPHGVPNLLDSRFDHLDPIGRSSDRDLASCPSMKALSGGGMMRLARMKQQLAFASATSRRLPRKSFTCVPSLSGTPDFITPARCSYDLAHQLGGHATLVARVPDSQRQWWWKRRKREGFLNMRLFCLWFAHFSFLVL